MISGNCSRHHNVVLQMGGSDQWGNIVSGVEAGAPHRPACRVRPDHPADRHRLRRQDGKTAKGAVWLSPARLSAWDYWQFWRNTEDADVGRFLRLFTDLPLPEIDRLAALQGAEVNEAKKVLATAATALAHGEAAAAEAAETARSTFEAGGAADTLPTHLVAEQSLAEGIPGVPPARGKRPGRQPGRGKAADPWRRCAGERHRGGGRDSRGRHGGICATARSSCPPGASSIGWCGSGRRKPSKGKARALSLTRQRP